MIWLRIKHVPLIAWNYNFFANVAGVMGELVCLDKETEARSRYDIARILIATTSPHIQSKLMKVMVDDEVVTIRVEVDNIDQGQEYPLYNAVESGYTTSSSQAEHDGGKRTLDSDDTEVTKTASSDTDSGNLEANKVREIDAVCDCTGADSGNLEDTIESEPAEEHDSTLSVIPRRHSSVVFRADESQLSFFGMVFKLIPGRERDVRILIDSVNLALIRLIGKEVTTLANLRDFDIPRWLPSTCDNPDWLRLLIRGAQCQRISRMVVTDSPTLRNTSERPSGNMQAIEEEESKANVTPRKRVGPANKMMAHLSPGLIEWEKPKGNFWDPAYTSYV